MRTGLCPASPPASVILTGASACWAGRTLNVTSAGTGAGFLQRREATRLSGRQRPNAEATFPREGQPPKHMSGQTRLEYLLLP